MIDLLTKWASSEASTKTGMHAVTSKVRLTLWKSLAMFLNLFMFLSIRQRSKTAPTVAAAAACLESLLSFLPLQLQQVLPGAHSDECGTAIASVSLRCFAASPGRKVMRICKGFRCVGSRDSPQSVVRRMFPDRSYTLLSLRLCLTRHEDDNTSLYVLRGTVVLEGGGHGAPVWGLLLLHGCSSQIFLS